MNFSIKYYHIVILFPFSLLSHDNGHKWCILRFCIIFKLSYHFLSLIYKLICCFILFSGIFGLISMLFLSLHKSLHIAFALLSLLVGSAGVAIADVTIDACVAQKSGSHPSFAADMQSLCSLSASIGALVGFSISGIFVHLIGPRVCANFLV